MLQNIIDVLGQFALFLGVPAGVCWIVGQKAAEKWIESHFTQRQKLFEHELATELQETRARIDTVIQGSLKLQEREFKILPESWEKSVDAFLYARWLCAPAQEYTAVGRMTAEQLEEFLGRQTELWEADKEEVRGVDIRERDDTWRMIDNRYRHRKGRRKLFDAEQYLRANSLFIPVELMDLFKRLMDMTSDALISFDIGASPAARDNRMITEASARLRTDGEPLKDQIESILRARLLAKARLEVDDQDAEK